jgi:hypothetical protein
MFSQNTREATLTYAPYRYEAEAEQVFAEKFSHPCAHAQLPLKRSFVSLQGKILYIYCKSIVNQRFSLSGCYNFDNEAIYPEILYLPLIFRRHFSRVDWPQKMFGHAGISAFRSNYSTDT